MQRHVLGRYFSPDDLVLLERVRGVAPPLPSLWRWLSHTAYFWVVGPWFGANPLPYFLLNLALHASSVALVYLVARRCHASILAATVAAALFGASRLGFGALAQAVGFDDLLALALSLTACLAVASRRPIIRTLGLVVFVGALLAKESVMLLPLAWLVVPMEEKLANRVRRWGPLLLAAVLWMAYLLGTNVRHSMLGGPAYRTGLGLGAIGRLLSYAQWSVDVWTRTPDYTGRPLEIHWATGALVLAVWISMAVWTWKRSKLVAFGLAWWLFGIIPVIPLIHQRNAYYVYEAWVGVGLALGGLFDAANARARGPSDAPSSARRTTSPRLRLLWGLAGVVVITHALISNLLLERRVSENLPDVDLPDDALVRKQEVIRRVSDRVGAAFDHRRVRIVFYNPEVRGTSDFYSKLMSACLDEGRGLRALHPNVDSVAFLQQWLPAYADFDLVVAEEDGYVIPLGKGPEAHQRLLTVLLRNGFTEEALRHATAATEAYPEDPGLALAYATSLLANRDTTRAAAMLHQIEEHAPAQLAARARKMLGAIAAWR